MGKKTSVSNTNLVFEELEPRLLLSADGLAVITESSVATLQNLVHSEDEHTIIVQQHDELSSTAVHDNIQNTRTELVILDSRAPNFQQLHNDIIKAQQQGRDINVVILDAHRDGLEQISEALSKYDKLDAVHIVSHGSEGQLQLGATQLDKETLKQHSEEIKQWQAVFDDAGDLLLYGCNLANTTDGQSLVDELAKQTSADVAASDDLTGNSILGGDWDLEYQTGEIESSLAFSEDVQDNWQGTLKTTAPVGAEVQPQQVITQEQQAQLEREAEQAVLLEEAKAAAKVREEQAQVITAEEQRKEIIFVDQSVTGYQSFIDNLQSNSNNATTFEIILLDGDRNGIEQINEKLSESKDIDALHIFSHGTDGAIKLGNTWLNENNLADYSDSLATWSNSLDQNADILFYGCNLADSESGELFINKIAFLTDADVAASDDLTGSINLGGDWLLEYKTGTIETSIALSTAAQTEYQSVLSTFVVSNTNATGAGSLHQAILDSNANTGITDTITFNIAGAGPHVINLTGALPAITDTVIINASTEPDYTGDPVVRIDGSSAGVGVNGLTFGALSDNSIVRGLMITNFLGYGIQIDAGADGITIANNWIGTTGTGSTGVGNNNTGINIQGANTIVGGIGANDGNVITNNNNEGINVTGAGATGTIIQGNIIGLDPDGSTGSGNTDVGIALLTGAHNTIIGGTVAAERNVISNNVEGIEINSNNNVVQGNYIGTDIGGTLDRGNHSSEGIQIKNSGTGNLIGGTADGAGNIIAYSGSDGIQVDNGTGNTILGNSIYSSTGQAIDIGVNGVLVNDSGDGDTGANNSQNFPVLTAADTNTVDTIVIDGTINSTANSYFRIEYFASNAADGTGYGEGEAYLGFVNVATDGGGNASFSATLSATVANGAVISATATRSDATYTTFTDTSEFAANINAVANFSPSATDDPLAFNNYLTSLGPTSHWRLGEAVGAVAVDQTGLSDGTYNGPTLSQTGAISADADSALQFDGIDDYVVMSHDPAYLLDDGTVQLWFNTADVTQRADLFSKDALGEVTGGHLSIYLDGAGNIETRLQSASASYLTTSTLPLTNNQWHHVAFTFGADGMQLYVDGQLQDSDVYTGGMGTTSGGTGNFEPIVIGASTQISGTGLVTPLQDYYTGNMDEVALFGTALSADQIQNLYSGGLQNYTVLEDNTINVSAAEGVLINDYDQEGNPLTAVLVSGPANAASFTLNPDGSFDYTPLANFSGTDTFTYKANDGTSDSNVATATITVNAVNDAPADLMVTETSQGGVSLNEDGGNDVYYVADDGAGLLGGLTTVTIETSFSITTPGADLSPLLSYADGANDEELALFLKSDGRIWFGASSNGSPIASTTGNYLQLFDGEKHQVSVSWDNLNGDVVFYVDGQLAESITAYQSGQTITGTGELVFGQDQDSVLGGFKTIDVFSGSLYDVRIFNDVRTAGEVAAGYDQTLPNTEPGMIANWAFNDMSGGVITEAVSSNNLTEQHVIGVGFSTSTPELTFSIPENSANGTAIGTVVAIDPDAGDTFTYSLFDNAGGRFTINSSTGQITLVNTSLIDFETAASHNITIRVTDSGALTYDEVFTVNVINVNESPINTVPGTQTVVEDTQTAIAGLSVADPDAGASIFTTQLTVTNGVLDVTLSGAATISAGANGSNTLTISGNVTDINATLASLQYTGNSNVNGVAADTLTVVTDDLGNTGTGGAQTDTDIVQIDITAVNDAPVARDDRIGLVFDGVDDYVRIGDYAGLIVTTNMTMEAWIKPTGLGTGSKIIINKEGEYELGITADTGEVKWAFDNIDPDWNWHNTGYFAQAGEWTHLTVTYNNGVVNTYANGVLVDTYNGSGAIADNYPTMNDLTIGGRENAVTQRFDGSIDEVRIWNTTRAQVDIASNMNSLLSGAETGLIGNWRFDEGSGVTVTDQSVLSHDGTLADGVTVAEMPGWQGYVVSEEGTLNVSAVNGVLPNDYDIDGDTLTAILVSGPANAAAFTLNPDGSFTYTPTANFNGIDSFTYSANDGSVDSNIATVTIRVDAVNDVPTTSPVTLAVIAEDSGVRVITQAELLSNANDIDGDALTATNLAISAGLGSLVDNFDGTWNYTPALNDDTAVSFSYNITDGVAPIVASASLDITPINDTPTVESVIPDQVLTEDFASYTIDLNAAFADVETADAALVYSVTGNTNINVSIAAGIATITPTANWNGSETLTFTATDAGLLSVDQAVLFTVNPANDTPTVEAVIPDQVLTEDFASYTIDLNAAFADVETADAALVYSVTGNTNINVSIAVGIATITPTANWNGSETLTFTATDAGLLSVDQAVLFTVNPANDTPTVESVIPDQVLAEDFASYTIDLNAAFADVETADAALVYSVTGNTNINVSIAAGIATITPTANWSGSETLTFTATDVGLLSVDQAVLFTVNPVNDAPTALDDAPAAVNEGGTVIFDLAANDLDIENALDLNSISIIGVPANGSLIVNSNGTVTYTHDGSETISDSFSYTIADLTGAISNIATVSVIINPVNDAPSALDDVQIVSEGGTVNVNLAVNDTDIDNAINLNSIAIVGAPANGSLIINANGTVDYIHDGSQTLSDTFSYTIADVSGAISNTATVAITISPVNNAPTTAGITDVTVAEDSATTNIDLNAAFDDVDNLDTELTYSITGNTGIGNFSSTAINAATGELSLDYAADVNGSSQISVRATDPSGASVDTLFTVTVTPVNDAPVLVANSGITALGTGSTVISNAELSVSDIDNADVLIVYTVTELPTNGAFLVNGVPVTSFTEADLVNNRVSYQSDGTGTNDHFVFTVSDGVGGTISNNTFNIVVDLPAFVPGSTPGTIDPDANVTPEPFVNPVTSPEINNVLGGDNTVPPVQEIENLYTGGSTRYPTPPELTLDPAPQITSEQVDRDRFNFFDESLKTNQTAGINFSGSSTVADIQVKSIKALWVAIDEMKQRIDDNVADDMTQVEFRAAAVSSSGVALTAGVVAWVLRSGALMTSLISTIPLWKGYDPLPILAYKDDDEEENVAEDKIPTSLKEMKKIKEIKETMKKHNQVDNLFGGSEVEG